MHRGSGSHTRAGSGARGESDPLASLRRSSPAARRKRRAELEELLALAATRARNGSAARRRAGFELGRAGVLDELRAGLAEEQALWVDAAADVAPAVEAAEDAAAVDEAAPEDDRRAESEPQPGAEVTVTVDAVELPLDPVEADATAPEVAPPAPTDGSDALSREKLASLDIDGLAEVYDIAASAWQARSRAGDAEQSESWRAMAHAVADEASGRPEMQAGGAANGAGRLLHRRRDRLRDQLREACLHSAAPGSPLAQDE
jgi:hypothetical protein